MPKFVFLVIKNEKLNKREGRLCLPPPLLKISQKSLDIQFWRNYIY